MFVGLIHIKRKHLAKIFFVCMCVQSQSDNVIIYHPIIFFLLLYGLGFVGLFLSFLEFISINYYLHLLYGKAQLCLI